MKAAFYHFVILLFPPTEIPFFRAEGGIPRKERSQRNREHIKPSTLKHEHKYSGYKYLHSFDIQSS